MEKQENRNKLVGERVRKIRERFGVTQAELSRVIGSNSEKQVLVRMIEKGERGLTAEKMRMIVEEYDLNPDYLLLRSDFMTYDDMHDFEANQISIEGEAKEIFLRMVARKAGLKLSSDLVKLAECATKKSYHFIDENGKEDSFTAQEMLFYMEEISDYAVYQLKRMIRKNNPRAYVSFGEGVSNNG